MLKVNIGKVCFDRGEPCLGFRSLASGISPSIMMLPSFKTSFKTLATLATKGTSFALGAMIDDLWSEGLQPQDLKNFPFSHQNGP
jgi:hypothetical protein